jgi:hypothetical protein
MTRPSCKVIWINCDCIFQLILFCNGLFSSLIIKTLWNLLSSSTNHIFYIVIYLHLHSIIGLFPRCWWNQWDSSPIHHRYSNTNLMWTHVIIWSQWCHFYGCHIWHKWHEIPSIHLDGVWRSSFSLDHYK